MPCYHPVAAYQGTDGRVFYSSERRGQSAARSLLLPCRRCVGCRLEHSRQWACRCFHESKLWPFNSFVTLTYSDAPASLDYDHFQRFLKRLRRRFPSPIRFFCCGEYGDLNRRAHWHALLFNCFFTDRVSAGKDLYTSKLLEEVWGYGLCTIGEVTFESAAYVARYAMKKLNGARVEERDYGRVDMETGEVLPLEPEMLHMSLKPGIGHGWINRHWDDVYSSVSEGVMVNGHFSKPPRYYDKLLQRRHAHAHHEIILDREDIAIERAADNTPERLAVRETVVKARLSLKKRDL